MLQIYDFTNLQLKFLFQKDFLSFPQKKYVALRREIGSGHKKHSPKKKLSANGMNESCEKGLCIAGADVFVRMMPISATADSR